MHGKEMIEREEVRVTSISPVSDRGALKAFVEIQVGSFLITDCRIIQENGKRLWVSMPVLSYKNEHGTVRYKTLIQISDKNLKNEIAQTVIKAWENNREETNEPRTKD